MILLLTKLVLTLSIIISLPMLIITNFIMVIVYLIIYLGFLTMYFVGAILVGLVEFYRFFKEELKRDKFLKISSNAIKKANIKAFNDYKKGFKGLKNANK